MFQLFLPIDIRDLVTRGIRETNGKKEHKYPFGEMVYSYRYRMVWCCVSMDILSISSNVLIIKDDMSGDHL